MLLQLPQGAFHTPLISQVRVLPSILHVLHLLLQYMRQSVAWGKRSVGQRVLQRQVFWKM